MSSSCISCIVASCISSATLIQMCCPHARFCAGCSYVQNTVGANITKSAPDLYLARSTYKSGEASQNAKLYWQNRTPVDMNPHTNKLLHCLYSGAILAAWKYVVSKETQNTTPQNRQVYNTHEQTSQNYAYSGNSRQSSFEVAPDWCPLFSLWTMSSVTFLLVDNVKWIGLCCPALNLLLTSVCANEMVSRNLPTSCSKIISAEQFVQSRKNIKSTLHRNNQLGCA